MSTSKFRILHLADDSGPQHWEYLTLPDDLIGEHWMDKDAYDWKTWSQWTGLLDKHGEEVYKGDIVRTRNVHAPTSHIFEVFWREKFAGFFLKELGAMDEQHEWIDLMHGGNVTDLEIIGNVYEHGHLLREDIK